MPPIQTGRLDLVPLRPQDAHEMVEVLADPSLYAFTGGQPPTLDELRERFSRWAQGSPRSGEDWHNWIIRLRDGGLAVGHLQVTLVDGGPGGSGETPRRHSADIAWLVGTAWQGRGYASEAARALVTWLESIGVVEITAHIAAEHVASGRVAAAAGLVPTADTEHDEVVWRLPHAAPGSRPRSAP